MDKAALTAEVMEWLKQPFYESQSTIYGLYGLPYPLPEAEKYSAKQKVLDAYHEVQRRLPKYEASLVNAVSKCQDVSGAEYRYQCWIKERIILDRIINNEKWSIEPETEKDRWRQHLAVVNQRRTARQKVDLTDKETTLTDEYIEANFSAEEINSFLAINQHIQSDSLGTGGG